LAAFRRARLSQNSNNNNNNNTTPKNTTTTTTPTTETSTTTTTTTTIDDDDDIAMRGSVLKIEKKIDVKDNAAVVNTPKTLWQKTAVRFLKFERFFFFFL
jgi:hypothetical protein